MLKLLLATIALGLAAGLLARSVRGFSREPMLQPLPLCGVLAVLLLPYGGVLLLLPEWSALHRVLASTGALYLYLLAALLGATAPETLRGEHPLFASATQPEPRDPA